MSKRKKKSKGIAGMALFLGWLIFILLALVFYFYFSDGFLALFGKDKAASEGKNGKSDYIYEVDAYPEINNLISSYLKAEAECDKDTLTRLVTNPAAFDDMSNYEEKAKVITGYENIKCYTVSVIDGNDMIVYAVSNMRFSDVSGIKCKPLNINRYYIKKGESGYLIDNALSDAVVDYMDKTDNREDIQELYKMVHDDVEACAAEDEAFNRVYKIISESGQ